MIVSLGPLGTIANKTKDNRLQVGHLVGPVKGLGDGVVIGASSIWLLVPCRFKVMAAIQTCHTQCNINLA